MASTDRARPPAGGAAILEVRGLNVHYGASHALQGVDLTLPRGVLSVVGRNGMGKTTLCKAIMGLVRPTSGSIRFEGEELTRLDASAIARLGIGYVPQGRRLWPSLSVDEHLRLAQGGRRGSWSPERVYDAFPRLAERKENRGGQLSGGEQQMLAISRALLISPRLLVMDEPTEGLAPVIVAHVEDLLSRLAEDGEMAILIIEQNIGVATEIAETVAIMVNGRINRTLPSAVIAADRDLQQRLLGVGRHGHEEPDLAAVAAEAGTAGAALAAVAAEAGTAGAALAAKPAGPARVYVSNPVLPTRWSEPVPIARIEAAARTVTAPDATPRREAARAPVADRDLHPVSTAGEPVVLVVGTLDTRADAMAALRDGLKGRGLRLRMVDLSTTGRTSSADVLAHHVAAHHRRGAAGVFTGDRVTAVAAMGEAFAAWIRRQNGIAGVVALGGPDGTAMALAGLAALGPGVPKLLVTSASLAEVAAGIGSSDVVIVPAPAGARPGDPDCDRVLARAAAALAGMVAARGPDTKSARGGPAARTVGPAARQGRPATGRRPGAAGG